VTLSVRKGREPLRLQFPSARADAANSETRPNTIATSFTTPSIRSTARIDSLRTPRGVTFTADLQTMRELRTADRAMPTATARARRPRYARAYAQFHARVDRAALRLRRSRAAAQGRDAWHLRRREVHRSRARPYRGSRPR